jgi:geranylgeranyl reductase family protein
VAHESYVTMDAWDAIVLGAGPGGCAAAYDLAVAGQSVLLLDKSDFPRPKACAGGLTIKAVKTLRYPIEPVVRTVVRRVQLESEGLSTSLRSREPICVMTVRAEFDEYCLSKTIGVGADFRKISAVREITRSESGVQLTTGDAGYRARFLIGADGASGQVRRFCGNGGWFSPGFALEVQTSMPKGEVDLTFDFGSVPQGYAWVFPKGDHLNIGVYSQSCSAGLTRSGLLRYVKQRLGVDAADHVTGQYLGMGAEASGVDYVRADLRDRVLLVGDAGGFVDRLTGEGIYGALLSGQAAAGAVLAELRGDGSATEVFAASVRGYRQTLRFSARAAGAFYRNPERGFRAMRLPLVRRTMVRTYTHGLNVNSLAMRVALSRC